jgi:hypothetical protein
LFLENIKLAGQCTIAKSSSTSPLYKKRDRNSENKKKWNVVELLLQSGGDVNSFHGDSRITLMKLVVLHNDVAAAEMLFSYGFFNPNT